MGKCIILEVSCVSRWEEEVLSDGGGGRGLSPMAGGGRVSLRAGRGLSPSGEGALSERGGALSGVGGRGFTFSVLLELASPLSTSGRTSNLKRLIVHSWQGRIMRSGG